MDIETLNHLFLECIQVQHFWTNLSILLQEYNVHIKFNLRYILLGITGKNRTEIQLKNYIILLGKYFIFKSKSLFVGFFCNSFTFSLVIAKFPLFCLFKIIFEHIV